jgi:protein-tyrosine phosphatase
VRRRKHASHAGGGGAAGWSALAAYGIRTIVDLRNHDERRPEVMAKAQAAGLAVVHVPLDDRTDTAFWDRWGRFDGTPLFFRPFLNHKPQRCAAAVAAVANADPSGVVVHCAGGRDRTGLVVLLLLALAGVVPDDIVADYQLSAERLRPAYQLLGWGDVNGRIERTLAAEHTTVRAALLATLASLDAAAVLRVGGLGDADLAAARARLLGPEPTAV